MKKQELYIPLNIKSLKFYLLHLKQYPPTYESISLLLSTASEITHW